MDAQFFSVPVAQASAALIGALVVWMRELLRRRSVEDRHSRSLHQLRDEIDTLQAWLTTYHLVVAEPARAPADRAAEARLDLLFRRFVEVQLIHRQAESKVEGVPARWGMSVVSTIMFVPVGLVSLYFSHRVRELVARGDPRLASRYSNRVRWIFWTVLVLFALYVLYVAGNSPS